MNPKDRIPDFNDFMDGFVGELDARAKAWVEMLNPHDCCGDECVVCRARKGEWDPKATPQ